MAELEEPSILAWYDARTPMFIDLVGDYAGKELFLVEGDSLLRDCFEDERIDFHDGFQLLHAAFVVERFLENLIKRHCQFHVAFFDDHRELCIPPGIVASRRSRYLLARSVVIRHLQLHLPESFSNVKIHTFSSIQSDQFSLYFSSSPIHFVMIHDGALPMVGKAEEEHALDRRAKVLLRGIIWWFNTNKLNVSLLNRIEFRDSKVFAMILESTATTTDSLLQEMTTSWDSFRNEEQDASKISSSKTNVDIEAWLAKPTVQDVLISTDDKISATPESWLLAACSISALLSTDPSDLFFSSAFVLHVLLIKHLPLSQRRLPLITFDEALNNGIETFLESFSEVATQIVSDQLWSNTMGENDIACDLVDMVDGRLFRATVQAILDGDLANAMPEDVKGEWENIAAWVSAASGKFLSLDAPAKSNVLDTDEEGNSTEVDVGEGAVMQFSNPIFDKHLSCIHVEAESTLPSRLASLKLYRETTHWHNHRKPLNPKQAPAEKISKWRNPLRTNQFYMAEMTSYAASLTGAKGRALEPETITVGVKKLGKLTSEVDENPPAKKGGKVIEEKVAKPGKGGKAAKDEPVAKKGGKKAVAGLTKAQQIIADNKEKKGGAESDKAFAAWSGVMKGFDEIASDQARYLKAKDYLDALDNVRSAHVEADINIYLCQCLLNWWVRYCKAEKKSEGYHVIALLWTVIRSICSSKAPITKEVAQHVEKISTMVGITNAMSGFNPATATETRKLSFTFKYPLNPQSLRIALSQSEFQLLHCGPYMDRYLDAQPDARVSSFVPDGWQRKVLDELDADNSVFVVAPTSAGKTFISFYAMEKVLRNNNDDVLVYVAPTKALVNQIAAEIQGRFSKKFPMAGKSVWAIHTRDYRVNNSTGCQILVTVPHILQIMLLAPTNAKSWAPRVKRIIFDEIHCIGAAEDGVVWEQLLLLAPCPIIALSATIGNPEQFSEWLAETQKASNTKLTMVQHSTRYSDLRKYLYQPPSTFKFEGFGKSHGAGLGLDGLPGLTYFHPVASLVDKSRGMPDDLALEPRDCFLLWKTMCKLQNEAYKVPDSLDPVKALPVCIKKADIFIWEKALKKVLLEWMSDSSSPFEKVVRELNPQQQAREPTSSSEDIIDPDKLTDTTLPLLYQLHQRQALPAILFNYDRAECEDMAEVLLGQLKAAENIWKEGKEWQRKIDGWTKWKELKDKKGAKKPPKASKKKGGEDDEKTSKADQAMDAASSEVSSYDLFDPEAPQDDFSFADKRRAQASEIDTYIRQLRWKNIKEELIELLQRGVGVHHAGMNRKYRQCVEMLFRKGYLRVVIATGTLSLGINMPCATVVFSGDSVFLTALNFRQASGRSGRRGFDLLGNVVFQGIGKERASRLLSSRLPDLTGHFPITTTLVLRLFTLLHDSKSAPYAIRAINSLLSQPRLYMGGDSFKEQVLHHLRFSIEYLRRQNLLGPSGEPVNFTPCVSHLYFTENSSFAFHALLKDGYFSKLCADIDTKSESVLRTMMLVLSHLFGRQVCRETDDEEMAEKIKRSPSIVYLPPLPTDAAVVLKKHNATTLAIFTTYVKTFAAEHFKGEETHLPLTHLAVGRPGSIPANGHVAENGLVKANGSAHVAESSSISFLPSLPRPHARSAFVALSGHGDGFTTISDLCTSARSEIFLESAVVPHLEIHPEETRTPLNAYLLDFFTHGGLQPLETANGIRRSDVWFILNDFSLVLATICTSLALYLGLGPKGKEGDEEMLDIMGSGDAAENDRDEEEAAETMSLASSTPSAAQAPAAPLRRGKKNVAEDWDADEDAIVALEKRVAEGDDGGIGTDDEEYEKLMNVYRAFRKLRAEFDAKFREIWA